MQLPLTTSFWKDNLKKKKIEKFSHDIDGFELLLKTFKLSPDKINDFNILCLNYQLS